MVDKNENIIRFDVGGTPFAILKKTFPAGTLFYSVIYLLRALSNSQFQWFVSCTQKIPFCQLDKGAYFVDRDPFS